MLLYFSTTNAQSTSSVQLANTIIDLLKHNDVEKAYELLDTSFTNEISKTQFIDVWNRLTQQIGDLESIGKFKYSKHKNDDVFTTVGNFEEASLAFHITVNEYNKISGFLMRPGPPKFHYNKPAYVDTSLITEIDTIIRTGNFKLPAKITKLKNAFKTPVVVLVHGSGPNDMDESIGKNKPFADLALGLATKGITVIRYNKRTAEYADSVGLWDSAMTVMDETVYDAISAINLAKKLPYCDTGKVYVIGHSLGAMLAPRIAKNASGLKGIVMMAGNARKLDILIEDQLNYLKPPQYRREDDKKEIDSLIKELKYLRSPKLNIHSPSKYLPSRSPASYWLDLRTYNQVQTLKGLKNTKVLILQGKRDYQVTMKDFAIWKQTFVGSKYVQLKSYPKLNHIFTEGEGNSYPQEYYDPKHIPVYVIEDIVAWIKK